MKRATRQYYFSVEGETEKMYFEWLKNTINAQPNTKFNVVFKCSVEKNPMSFVKKLSVLGKTKIVHIFDYESNESDHTRLFLSTLDSMREAESSSVGKKIKYNLGYSNYTFELWMILHKIDCFGIVNDRKQYLKHINNAFGCNYNGLSEYKHKDEFQRILKLLTLDDVKKAINRSQKIMLKNENSGYTLRSYKGFTYYKEKPSLSIWKAVQEVLGDCGLI